MRQPDRARRLALVVLASGVALAGSSPALAQEGGPLSGRRVAIDSVIGTQDFFGEDRDWPTQVVFDTFMTAQPRPGWQVSFRPKLWRTSGAWELLVDQASIRHEFRAVTHWRVEAGIFPSPIGYGIMENRPNINAGGRRWHRPYYMPLPKLAPGFPQTSLISTVYPAGLSVSTSATHWDLRGALVNKAPIQFWHGEPQVPRERPHDRRRGCHAAAGPASRRGRGLGRGRARGGRCADAAVSHAQRRGRVGVRPHEAEWRVGP